MVVLSKEQLEHGDDSENVASNADAMTSILEFMNDFARKLRFGDRKNVVLMLGNTGAGKTTLTSLLSGVELESKEVVPGSGEFVIVDEKELISGQSTTVSKTEIPELMFDADNKIAYYDCPGFNDSRGVEHDVSVSYLIKKLIKFADSVKLVFAISFSSVRAGVGDRNDFMDLAKHAINFAKNIDRYHDGIALIVTKVENRYVTKNRQPQLIGDDKIIEAIVEFLKQAKTDLENSNQQDISLDDQELIRMKITFIEILLEQNQQNEYTKIGILRLANESGPVHDIEMLQEERKTITKLINRNLKFVNKENTDFGYTISEATKNRIHDKMDQMQDRLTKDVQNIGDEIYAFYLQQEKHISDLNVLKEQFAIAHRKLEEIECNDPKNFVKLITNAANELKIGITIDNSKQFWNHMECLEFINAVSKINLSNLFNISTGLAGIRKYLLESKKWYSFLIELHDKLSEYNVQKNKSKYNVDELMSCVREHQEVNVNDIGLEQLLNKIGGMDFTRIENIQLNSFKQRALEELLNQTLVQFPEFTRSTDGKLVVKGYNIKISDICQYISRPGWVHLVNSGSIVVKYIEVFAINNLFIDMDMKKTGQKLQLSIIAPTWHVIGDRQINLNGKDAEPHSESKAKDGQGGLYEIDGKNGLAGKPGGAAGHFMGIGKNFLNVENLQINISGGKGGAGQHGGNGADAEKGDDPEIPAFKSFGTDFKGLIKSSRFTWCKVPPFFGVEYDVRGTDGLKAGKGGHGGVGGYGGNPGKYFIAGFDNHTEIYVLNKNGDSGTNGKGGKGGKEATKGSNVAAEYVFAVVGFLNLDRKDSPKMAIEAGESGIDAESRENLQCAENPDPFINACRTINDYKSYVRGYLPNNIFETKLGEFLAHFEADQRIQSQYDTLGLVHELQGLERHYIELRDKISLVPFVKSLLRRINNYAQNDKLLNDDKIVLNLLNAAALTKLSSIKNRENYASIIDLLAYTQLVRKNIKMLRSAKRNEAIQGYQEKFAESVQMKIELAHHFIQSQILPDIKRNFTEIDQCIHALIDENGSQQSIIREQELKNALFKQRIWFWIEVISPLLLCLGMTAGVVFASGALAGRFLQKSSGSVASSAAKIALGSGSKLALESSSNASKLKNLSVPMSEIKSTISNLKAKLEDGVKDFKKEFHFWEQKSREYLGNDTVKKMKLKIGEPITDLVKATLNSSGVEKNSKDLRANAVQAVKTVQQLPEDRKEPQEKSMEFVRIDQSGKSFDIQDAPAATVAAPTAARSLSKKSENLLRSLEMQEKHLYEAIMPQLHEIESSVTAMEHKLSKQSHVELDLSKWRVQSLLKNLKAYFNRLTIGFTIEGDVKQIIDKINEGMCVLIGVYDRIDSYVEKLELSALMANMATTSHRTGNGELNKVISSLEKIIQTNIILEQYETVVHALRQHMFPFVHLNMTNCWLTSKSTDNTDADVLVEQAIKRIDHLAKQLTSASISIEKYDKDIINIKSDDLYTWKNAEIQPKIGQLLQGDEIILKADIANGINQNAVKFNEIAINFKVSDDKAQTELNEKLQDFDVTLTMMGNCYYRCGNRSYYVPIDENIVIEYSMKKDKQGHPKSTNEVYRKIKDGTYFLSPYTTWSIKLSHKAGNNFHDLAKLKNMAIDLKLVGNVQYFKYIKAFSDEFSDELLNKHYNFDRIIPYECDEKLLNSF